MCYYTCEICGQAKKDVAGMPDPYTKELDGGDAMMYLCDECYEDRQDDI